MKNAREAKLYSVNRLKGILANLLAKELALCSNKIDASFEMSGAKYIFCIRFNENSVRMWININTVGNLLRQSEMPYMVGMHYCVFFIANYIMQAENAFDMLPKTYCDGLTILNTIYDCNCGKKVRVYAPLQFKTQYNGKCRLRPLEMKCEIDALMKIRAQFLTELSTEHKNVLDKTIDARMLYFELPETAYENLLIPQFALHSSIAEITEISEKHTDVLSKYRIFDGLHDIRDVNQTVEDLINMYKKTSSSFYIEMFLRIVCCMRQAYRVDDFVEMKEALLSHANKYRNSCVNYCAKVDDFSSKIMNDNLLIILKLVKKINGFIENEEGLMKSGSIHSVY